MQVISTDKELDHPPESLRPAAIIPQVIVKLVPGFMMLVIPNSVLDAECRERLAELVGPLPTEKPGQ